MANEYVGHDRQECLSYENYVHSQPYNRLLHYLAIATCLATFPLIFMGGLVTSHGAGMSVPDWPNSYGYNMFLFPPSKWVGGIFYEHTHRLMGTIVGMLSTLLTIVAWRSDVSKRMKWLATSVLLAVIFQGVLGGLRVVLIKLNLAVVHACVAQAFFCLTALVAVVTSKRWVSGGSSSPSAGDANRATVARELDAPSKADHRLFKIACAAVVVIYLQLMVGATMRHYDAGLAIPDVPLAYGNVLPPLNGEQLHAVNQLRAWKLGLTPVTMTQVWLNFGHRVGAVAVSLAVLTVCIYVLTRIGELRGHAAALLALLVAQIALGLSVIIWRKPADLTSIHVAVGALCLVTSFVIAVRSRNLKIQPISQRNTGFLPTAKHSTSPTPCYGN